MDFNQYYLNQANGYPVFRGVSYQKGYGLGNAFRRFISWALPIFKEYALPVAKSIGKEVISSAANIANDALDGKDIKESASKQIKTSIEKFSPQKGSGLKRRHNKIVLARKNSKLNKKRRLDIFDQ